MKIRTLIITIALSSLSVTAQAKGMSEHASAASNHSVKAIGHGLASTTQVASGIAAAPFLVVGSVGIASLAVGETLMDKALDRKLPAQQEPSKPLEITEVTVTVTQSPAEAMQQAPE